MIKRLVFSTAILSILVPVTAAAANNPFGILLQGCTMNSKAGLTNGINVVYQNVRRPVAQEVDFTVRYGGQTAVFSDKGAFTQYAQINHNLTNAMLGLGWNGPAPASCAVTRVINANGNVRPH